MPESRIVNPQEALEALQFQGSSINNLNVYEVLHTVATEPDRTRAAVVKALREMAENWYTNGPDHPLRTRPWMFARADAIENGAPL